MSLQFLFSATRGQTEPKLGEGGKKQKEQSSPELCAKLKPVHLIIPLLITFFSHLKPLPPNPISNHSAAKQPAFSASLPEHVYQNCFGGAGSAGDWNSSLQCLSLKFENLWDAAVMKSWNPSVLLPESLPGEPPWHGTNHQSY